MNHDDLEVELGNALHRATGAVSTAAPNGGRDLIDRRLRQRAHRRRRNLGIGAVAAVAVLGGGVIALRPDPAQKVNFANSPAGHSANQATAVATGYATGSMSGMPTGWSHPDVDPSAVALPKVVALLDGTWTPESIWASSVSQGSDGTPAAPIAVLADPAAASPRFVVVSVQSPSTLGPGHGGETFSSNGLTGRIVSDNGNGVMVIADVPGGHRVEAVAVGVDRATLLGLIATLHQDGSTWALNPSGGLATVAAPAPTSTNSRSLSWTKALPAGTDPSTAPDLNVSVQVSSGGAYEFYGEAIQNGTNAYTGTSSLTTVLGHPVVASAVSTMKGQVQTLLLDDQGLVYNILQVDPTAAAGAIAPVALSLADNGQWSALVTAAATNQAQQQDRAMAAKRAAIAKAGGIDPASGAKAVGAADTSQPPTTRPPAGLTTTTASTSTPGTP